MSPQESDHYIQSAEMYDLLSEQHWRGRRDSVLALLKQLSETDGIVLDVGAGTGPCVRVIADALPRARIIAVEPSASMRVGLMTRIMLDPDLKKRVTVSATSIEETVWPDRLAAAVICGCIGYLDEPARLALWRQLASRLLADGFAVVDVMMIDRPQIVPRMRVVSTEVGMNRYDIWLEGSPGAGDIMRWKMSFEVLFSENVLRSFSVEREWHTFGLDRLADEAAAAGLRAERMQNSPVPTAILRLSSAHASVAA